MIRRRPNSARSNWLSGRRVTLRPLGEADFPDWQLVRAANHDWVSKWEPTRPVGVHDPDRNRSAFQNRCNSRRRDRQTGSGYAFGVFVGEEFVGEMNLGSISRGVHQSASVGYWISQTQAGNGYAPEALVAVMQFGFEDLGLHRVEVSIIPRNLASRRVVEKLDLRCEGLAERFLKINGVWEDHLRFAVTAEEWLQRREDLIARWL